MGSATRFPAAWLLTLTAAHSPMMTLSMMGRPLAATVGRPTVPPTVSLTRQRRLHLTVGRANPIGTGSMAVAGWTGLASGRTCPMWILGDGTHLPSGRTGLPAGRTGLAGGSGPRLTLRFGRP